MFDLSSADLLDAFTRELRLCKVREGEHVVVLSEPGSRGDYVAAAFGAAKACGAHVIAATVPGAAPRRCRAHTPARAPGCCPSSTTAPPRTC
ncbi:hypothetical protein SSPO_099490 [Streptomyces antimycoticus]|uniref:Uncharacterized protein n=1 Tax=Streptomyces antimycoticus TaxID=68175 RepID=A0A499VCI2_9ACTN|nr:hypothetical protein SSPO_099490 [Streptomyces antimycoticus]